MHVGLSVTAVFIIMSSEISNKSHLLDFLQRISLLDKAFFSDTHPVVCVLSDTVL